jgi:hypothetical protein
MVSQPDNRQFPEDSMAETREPSTVFDKAIAGHRRVIEARQSETGAMEQIAGVMMRVVISAERNAAAR